MVPPEKPWNLQALPYPQLCPIRFFHWLFLNSLLCNKLVMEISKLFSCVLWTLLAIYQTWGGILGTPDLNLGWTIMWVTSESSTWNWLLQSLWNYCACKPVDSDINSGKWCLNWIVEQLVGVWRVGELFRVGKKTPHIWCSEWCE